MAKVKTYFVTEKGGSDSRNQWKTGQEIKAVDATGDYLVTKGILSESKVDESLAAVEETTTKKKKKE